MGYGVIDSFDHRSAAFSAASSRLLVPHALTAPAAPCPTPGECARP